MSERAALNPFHAPWFLSAASGRLYRAEGVRMVGGVPIARERRLGRLPVPHDAALRHDHCFCGTPDITGGEALAALLGSARGPLLVLSSVPADSAAHHALTDHPDARVLQSRERALLRSTLSAEDYLAESLRGKKRKELRRLRARLEERGAVSEAVLDGRTGTDGLANEFLSLEARGWKGERGSAMALRPGEADFLRDALAGAAEAGALRVVRLALGDAPLAMILCFLGGDGGLYTYKIAHDPDHARSSPGVMAELFLTRYVLETEEIAYADSCAAEGHPMIEHIWRERRTLSDWAVPTGPAGRAVLAGMGMAGRARRPA